MGLALRTSLRAPGAIAVLLIGTLWALYWPMWRYPFVYEDAHRFETHAIPILQQSLTRWGGAVLLGVGEWLGGTASPVGPRLVTLGLHTVNAILVGGLAWRWIGAWGAVMAGGLYALHPLQIEAVVYVSGQADVLVATWVLVALWAASQRSPWLAWLACVGAVLTKEAGIAAFALVPLWVWWRGIAWSRLTWALWGLSISAPAGWLLMRFGVPLSVAWTLEQLAVVWYWVWLMLVPVWQTIDHDWRWITLPAVLSAGLLWLLVTLWAVWRGMRPWMWATAWTLVALSPRVVVPLEEGMHEHHLTVPLMGLAWLFGAWIEGEPLG